MAAYTAVAVQILRIWFRSMIDDGRRNALKHMTLVSFNALLAEKQGFCTCHSEKLQQTQRHKTDKESTY